MDVKSLLLRAMFVALMVFPVIYEDAMINNLEKEDSETVNKEDKNMSLDMF
jgi:hypothetical protein